MITRGLREARLVVAGGRERVLERAEMGLLRNRGGGEANDGARYQMREKLLSIGDDYWIEDDEGNRAFHVDGKALRVRQTFVIEDVEGNEITSTRSSATGTPSPPSRRLGSGFATPTACR